MRNFIKKYRRHLAFFFLVNFLAEVISPTAALALTSGPNQPETTEFQPINVSDMVNPATGDFSYNLPLLEIDGYPLNLSYRAGGTMDEEATFVGFGWNMNAGSISRNLRGIPDDFDGDKIVKKFNMKDNISYGVSIGVGGEFAGIDGIKAHYSMGLTHNNYTGYDFIQSAGFSMDLGSHSSIGLGVSSSLDGLTISPSLSFEASSKSKEGNSLKGSASLGTSFNSRSGIREISLSAGISVTHGPPELPPDPNNVANGAEPGKDDSQNQNTQVISRGSSITFGSPTYVPQITMPMHTSAIMGSFKLGGTAFLGDATADISGNYSRQSLVQKVWSYPSYGYLNLHKGQNRQDAMMDFNREKDGSFTEATTNLPIPNLTYDNYSVMGQGVGGQFRPFRSEAGFVFDPRATNTSESNSLGAELKLGNLVQAGADFVNKTCEGTSGKWTEENLAYSTVKFSDFGNADYEPAYFKEMGEMNIDDDPLYDNIYRESAVRFQLDDKGKSTGIEQNLITENSVVFDLNGKNQRSKRVKRNQLFSYLTVAECANFALQTSLYNSIKKLDGSGNVINGHHIGQITTTKTDGSRYVYGLPVYNNYQKEVTFNVSGFSQYTDYTPYDNLVRYTPGSDDTENNTKGEDHFFSSTETPPFAYAYLLTAVLSPDYVDRTGNGPTSDDIGTYTLFSYTTAVNNFEWRAPAGDATGAANWAKLDPGKLTNRKDNKASYVYGKKDICYLASIEGKNHIAILEYSDRQDGRGVNGDAGGTNTSTKMQKKLDRITLYSMNDYLADPSSAVKIKQVHLDYNYEICPQVPNFSGSTSLGSGKLTLKSVYFTFGNSNKGVLSPYKFQYYLSTNSGVIHYNPSCVDRWGGYKLDMGPFGGVPNAYFPYVEQNKTTQDENASLWGLRSIQLPSGGLMEITYESDDYAYIQNKRAGEMFKVAGCINNVSSPPSTLMGTDQLFSSGAANNYILFHLKQGAASSPATTFRKNYVFDMDYLYFRFFVEVNNGTEISDINFNKNGFEFIQGYAELEKNLSSNSVICGTVAIGGTTYGYVKVKEVRQKRNALPLENPISKAAWQFARTQTPNQAYNALGGTDPASSKSDIEGILRAMANSNFIKTTIQTFQGYNGTLKAAGLGKTFVPDFSWIRLSNPDFKKLGGGHRTKSVKIRDKWNVMGGYEDFQYGQAYEYTTKEDGAVISSGVATYEPTFGADENSFRKPVFMEAHKQEALLAPDNDMYVEEPMGESFFPSPSVVYSKVEIKSITAGAGKAVHEYYTSRDFPIVVHELGMAAKRKKPNPILNLFSFETYDRFTGSQGYSIELNDMSGKMKATHTYEEGGEQPINSTYYKYRSNGDRLVNTAKVVAKNGDIKDATMGIDYDFYADFRENNSVTQSIGVRGNLYTFIIPFIPPLPAVVVPVFPTYHSDEIQLRTAVTNKVIYRYGILERVVNVNNNQTLVTDNLLWDQETGQVLLTGTTTEFEDPIYSTAYPGHWAYETAAGGYKNTGLVIYNPAAIVSTSGQIKDPDYLRLLHPGDELAIVYVSGTSKGYVDKIGGDYFFTENYLAGSTHSSKVLASSDFTNILSIKVLRSGRHNLQDQKVGLITSFVSPLKGNPSYWPAMDESYEITNATAIDLGSTWQGYCGCGFMANGTTSGTAYPNQYIYGIKGNQRKVKDYTYLTNRKQTKVQGNSNIRVDGTLEKFSAFWKPNAGNDWSANPNGWTWASEASLNSPFGFDLENKDALERRSSAQYGYNQSLPVAVTANSKYKLSAFENFEYNDLDVCTDNHFGFNQHKAETYQSSGAKVQKYAHTGKRSIKVAPTGTVTVTRQLNPCTN